MSFLQRRKFVSVVGRRSGVPEGLWMKCGGCQEAVYTAEVEANGQVCPACGHHFRIGAGQRILATADTGTFQERYAGVVAGDPLRFTANGESYPERLDRARQDAGLPSALVVGTAAIEGTEAMLTAVDPFFIMGSMGSALGEKFHRAAQDAIAERLPLVCFAASGGARMHEGTVALMQMVKTVNAVRALNAAAIPFISVLTDPTSGGMFASFASLGDVCIAEPGAYIGFAGKRLIEGALGVTAPEGFQRAEFQFQHGFLDDIVPRAALRAYLGRLLRYLAPRANRTTGS